MRAAELSWRKPGLDDGAEAEAAPKCCSIGGLTLADSGAGVGGLTLADSGAGWPKPGLDERDDDNGLPGGGLTLADSGAGWPKPGLDECDGGGLPLFLAVRSPPFSYALFLLVAFWSVICAIFL